MDGAELRPAHAVVNYRKRQHERSENDWYVEPRWAVDALLDREQFVGSVWDPACGQGTIVTAARDRGLFAFGSDIADRGFGQRFDFLTGEPIDPSAPPENIVTNPPFKHAEAFIEKALRIARFKVAVLVRLAFLEGAGRHERLFSKHPPARALVYRSRVSMPPGGCGIEAKGGAVAFQWLVWQRDWRGPTVLEWL
jgi:hypothetical protein